MGKWYKPGQDRPGAMKGNDMKLIYTMIWKPKNLPRCIVGENEDGNIVAGTCDEQGFIERVLFIVDPSGRYVEA